MVPQLIIIKMPRIKFSKKNQQRKFIKRVLEKINCPSLRSLKERGFDIPYSTLKNYYSEKRLLSEEFFKNLCKISEINYEKIKFQILNENWGKVKGGKISKRK
jgi:predicted secreted protein